MVAEEGAAEEVGPRPMQVQARTEVSEQGEGVPGVVMGPVGWQAPEEQPVLAEERVAGRERGVAAARHWVERFLSGKGERCGSLADRSAVAP